MKSFSSRSCLSLPRLLLPCSALTYPEKPDNFLPQKHVHGLLLSTLEGTLLPQHKVPSSPQPGLRRCWFLSIYLPGLLRAAGLFAPFSSAPWTGVSVPLKPGPASRPSPMLCRLPAIPFPLPFPV